MLPHVGVAQHFTVEIAALLQLESIQHEIIRLVIGLAGLFGQHVFHEMHHLVTRADGQHLVVRVEEFLGRGHEDAPAAADHLGNVDAVFLPDGDVFQLLARVRRFRRDGDALGGHVVPLHLRADARRDGGTHALVFFLLVQVGDEALLQGSELVDGTARQDEERHAAQDDEQQRPVGEGIMDQDGRDDEGDGDEDAQEHQGQYRPFVAVFLPHQPDCRMLDVVAVDGQAVEERCHDHQRDAEAYAVAQGLVQVGHRPGEQLVEVELGSQEDGDEDHAVERHAQEIGPQQLLPFALLLRGRTARVGRGIELGQDLDRQLLIEEVAHRRGSFDHIGRGEGRDDRHRDDDRIDEAPHHPQAHAQARYDEGKLAQLRQAETRVDRRVHAAARHQRAHRAEERHAQHRGDGQDEDREPVLRDDSGIDQHAHRHEEDGAEEVFDAGYQLADVLSFNGFRENGTHDESAQRRGEARVAGQRHHAEAQADRHQQQDLVVQVAARPFQEGGDDIDAHQEPQDQEEQQLGQAHEHLAARELVGRGDGREQHHQHHRDEVFHHQRAENQRGVGLVLEPQVVVSLDDDGRGGHRHQAAQEDGFHGAPAHGVPHHVACDEHADAHEACRDERAAAHLEQLLEAELQAEGEEQEDDADLGPLLHGFRAGDAEEPQVRSHDEARDDVAQDERLLERFRYDGEESC